MPFAEKKFESFLCWIGGLEWYDRNTNAKLKREVKFPANQMWDKDAGTERDTIEENMLIVN